MPFISNEEHSSHSYETRDDNLMYIGPVRHEFAKQCIRQTQPRLINNTPKNVIDKVNTHSLKGFSNYAKKAYLEAYQNTCNVQNCYVCNNNQ